MLDDPPYDGVNRFEVTLPHASAVHPPLIRYSTVPAGIACRLTQLSYVAVADEPDERHTARAALTVRCRDIPEGARVRLDYGRPLVRSVRIHNGDGRLNVRLDKPPGSVNQQVLLRTTPFRIAGEVGDLLSCYVTGHNLLGSQTVGSLAVPIVLANRIL